MTNPEDLWRFLPLGYALSVLIETPILLLGLSSRHTMSRRFFAGFWLTACTYPIVVLVLPIVLDQANHPWRYLSVAETFAPVAECLLLFVAFGRAEAMRQNVRDAIAITVANLASFGIGVFLF